MNYVKNHDTAIGIVIFITVICLFIYGIWGFATFIELILGYALAKKNYKQLVKFIKNYAKINENEELICCH